MQEDDLKKNALLAPGSMKYVKLFVREWLYGTIRFDFEPEERGVFADLLAMAAVMRTKGLISAGKGMPFPRRWIAGTLNISEDLLDRVIEKGKEVDRISEDGDGILIVNWKVYQSEYDRQKFYRDKKKAGAVSAPDGPWDSKAWFAVTIHGTVPKVKFLSSFAEQRWGAAPNKPQESVALRQIVERYDIGPINEAMKILDREETIEYFPSSLNYVITDEVIGGEPKRRSRKKGTASDSRETD